MKNSYKFFQNKDCKYFPCHKELKLHNCLFCFCPLFHGRETNAMCIICGPCEECLFPHRPKDYDMIIKMLK
jgi:Zn-finger protein